MTPRPVGRGSVELEYHPNEEYDAGGAVKARLEERQEIITAARNSLKAHVAATDLLLNHFVSAVVDSPGCDDWTVFCRDGAEICLYFCGGGGSKLGPDDEHFTWVWSVADSDDRDGHKGMMGLVYSAAANRQSAALNDWIVQCIALAHTAPPNHSVRHAVALETI